MQINTPTFEEISNNLTVIDTDLCVNTSLLQSREWIQVKQSFGWNAYAFRQNSFATLSEECIVLVRHIKGLGYIGYIPDGMIPLNSIAIDDPIQISQFQTRLEEACMIISVICSKLHTMLSRQLLCIRWDVPWVLNNGQSTLQSFPNLFYEFRNKYKFASQHLHTFAIREPLQPPATVVISLDIDEKLLLAQMKAKTRYNIKLAGKKQVEITNKLSLDEFYLLYRSTSVRNNIAIHSKSYYEKVLEVFSHSDVGEVHIYGAWFEYELIASIIVVYFTQLNGDKIAVYLYGASSDSHRNLMPTYALQWEAICDAKQAKCTHYDLFGLPIEEDMHHRMYGMYRFKIGFGGNMLARLGAIEINVPDKEKSIVSRMQYKCFIFLEKLRDWYYYNYRKR